MYLKKKKICFLLFSVYDKLLRINDSLMFGEGDVKMIDNEYIK